DVQIRDVVLADQSRIGQTVEIDLFAHGDVDALLKGAISRDTPSDRRQLDDQQVEWVDKLVADGVLAKKFNWGLFKFGASSQPETAGLLVALIGSFFMMLTVIVLAVPLGVAAAAYLEEFAPKNWLTDIIEVNINNLAAVPSIVFGLLGLAVFINMFGLPRSAAVIGGLVLTLMTLPTIIIATRAAIRAVPPSIREAALGVGASKMQTLFHHTLPLALPGILTGTIIGLVQALGETAPLLMIGMVAFVVDAPSTPFEPSTALPVQIYMWATSAERGFVERTAGATIVLLMFLIVMNATAVILRRRFERKW
ncbi:MAG: phosphate ABC transporter permease PstA, partial [Pseudomonadota bacterium]